MRKRKPQPYEWDWSGAHDPGNEESPRHKTFSVGCFQWIPRTGVRHGLKKGKVAKRFYGKTWDTDSVYYAAREWCEEQNRTAPLPPCPICNKTVEVGAAKHGGHFIKCPPKGRAHTHVAGVTPADLRERWREHYARSTDPDVKP